MSLAAPARPSFLLEHVRLCLKHVSATYSVCSPPPCGEGLGVGVVRFLPWWRHYNFTAPPPPRPPSLHSAGDPPHKGEGKDRVRGSCRFHSSADSNQARRALDQATNR